MIFTNHVYSGAYPKKFNQPGHNLPEYIIKETISKPHRVYLSENKNHPHRLLLVTEDGDFSQNIVVVSALGNTKQTAKVISAWRSSKV